VRQYKARCVTRYDRVMIEAESVDALMDGFLDALGQTLVTEAMLHRLWYDLRAQALFEEAFRDDVAAIDKSLEQMIFRIMSRFADLSGAALEVPASVAYAMFDGLFQQGLLKHLSGDDKAVAEMQVQVRWAAARLLRGG
jgi:hypothetical protein